MSSFFFIFTLIFHLFFWNSWVCDLIFFIIFLKILNYYLFSSLTFLSFASGVPNVTDHFALCTALEYFFKIPFFCLCFGFYYFCCLIFQLIYFFSTILSLLILPWREFLIHDSAFLFLTLVLDHQFSDGLRESWWFSPCSDFFLVIRMVCWPPNCLDARLEGLVSCCFSVPAGSLLEKAGGC